MVVIPLTNCTDVDNQDESCFVCPLSRSPDHQLGGVRGSFLNRYYLHCWWMIPVTNQPGFLFSLIVIEQVSYITSKLSYIKASCSPCDYHWLVI